MRSWLTRLGAAFALVLGVTAAAAQTAPPYVNQDLGDAGIRLEGEIKTLTKPGNRKAPQLTKLGQEQLDRGEYQRAVESFSAAAVLTPRDAKVWMKLAEAMLEISGSSDGATRAIRQRAAALAYLAFQRATTPAGKAEALALVGRALADREEWRPALNAYRASLALADVEDVRTTYEELRDEHGFRVVDHSVDTDALTPRACVEFSDPLANTKSDYSPYVAVQDGKEVTVTAKDEQLCLDGLKHGERYAFTVRPGVPSTVGEVLEKPVEISIFIRDRKPEVRFTGRNYVLPKTGQRGIPVVSTNTDAVKVEIFRIGDRALVADIVDEDFQTQIGSYEAERLADEKGTKIWSGELAVERRQNEDVTTAFPIDTTVGQTAPGVYVMVAQPKTKASDEDDWRPRATQWFIVSDLGISSFSGDSGLVAVVRSLASATAVAEAGVRVLAKNNEVLATARTDAEGVVAFPPGLVRGTGGSEPAVLVVEKDGDYAFLDLTQPGFDLTDRGVAGREAPGPIDAFLYTERGVYRPGETVHATVLARDAEANALPDVPLTLVAERPDGVEYRSVLVGDQGFGGRVLSLPIQPTAMTGTWRLKAFADPKRPPVGETKFLVEDYLPERIEVTLEPQAETLSRTGETEIAVASRYLYGAPAAGLEADGEAVVSVAEAAPGALKDYRFGVEDDEITDVRAEIGPVTLDADGKASLSVSLGDLPATAQPLEAEITVRVTEAGGRAVSRAVTLPVARAGSAIGVKPLFEDQVPNGELAKFDVIVAAPDGTLLDRPAVAWSLLRVNTRFQWYSEGGRWRSETFETTARIGGGTVAATAAGPVRIEAPVGYGQYRLEVSMGGAEATVTSVDFEAGWYAEASAETPDLVRLVLDKPSYLVGEEARLTLEPRFAGKATIVVVGNSTHVARTIDVEDKPTEVRIPVEASWGAGAYAVALLHRPLDVAAGRMPGRAVGVAWIGLDRAPRTLAIELDAPAEMEPGNRMTIPLRVTGLAPGEQAYVTVAAVDVGILNLTRYKAPAPEDWYFAQRKLATEIRDLYGQLIDGMRATPGTVRSGGDGGDEGIVGAPPTEAPVALFSGIVAVAGPDGAAEVGFDIPPFNGTVRVMAVAWSRSKLGHAEADVLVRDPVVVTATLPRFLAAGDRSTLHFDFANVRGAPGAHRVDLSVDGPVTLPAEDLSRTIDLAAGGRGAATVAATGTGVGVANVGVKVTGPDGRIMERSYALGVRPTLPDISRRMVTALAPRTGSVTISPDLLADFVPGSGSVAIAIAPSSAIDVPALLAELDRYPYGCSEQITSRAMPLLYANELAKAVAMPIDPALDGRIDAAIERVLTRQSGSGGFGLWTVGDEDLWLNAYVTDFLTRAREKGHTVPDAAVTQALDQLRNQLSYSTDFEEGKGAGVAYALYVLARNGRAPLGDLRYFAEEKLETFGTALARAQIAGALALLGDRTRAEKAMQSAREALASETDRARDDYGSILRDRAAVLTLISESGTAQTLVPVLLRDIAEERAKRRYTSTQENAWLVMAAQSMAEAAQRLQLTVDGAPHSGPLSRTMKAAELAAQPVTVQNRGADEAQAIVVATGSPRIPEPRAEHGFSITRRYFDLDGKEVKPDRVTQTTRLVVVLDVTEPKPETADVLLVDRLPAGFEIDNPRLADSDSLKAFTFLKEISEKQPVHTEFRDDRFVAAYKRREDDRPVFGAAYVIRAVSPGQYIHPPATVEDMYRPERFGRTEAGRVEVVGK